MALRAPRDGSQADTVNDVGSRRSMQDVKRNEKLADLPPKSSFVANLGRRHRRRLSCARCQELYSEDMSHGREVDGVTIINPLR